MATVKCPSCRRMLNLPPALQGALVQCPSCGTTFEGPAEVVPILTAPPQAALTPEPLRPSQPPPLEVRNDAEEAGYYRVRKKVEAAAARLRLAVLFDTLGSVLCCPCFFFMTTRRDVGEAEFFEIVVVLGLIAEVVALGLICIGSYYLSRRRGRGMALTAAVLCFLLALKNLVNTAWPGLLLLIRAGGQKDSCLFLPTLALIVCTVLAAVYGIVGGVQTLIVLQDPEVSRDFR